MEVLRMEPKVGCEQIFCSFEFVSSHQITSIEIDKFPHEQVHFNDEYWVLGIVWPR